MLHYTRPGAALYCDANLMIQKPVDVGQESVSCRLGPAFASRVV